MDTQKTLNKINNSKFDPTLEQKMIEAKRISACEDLLKQLKKKFPITSEDKIDKSFMIQFINTQATMIRTGIYVSIDWKTNKYYAIDLMTTKVIEQ